MTSIPKELLDFVTEEVNALSEMAQSRILRILNAVDWTDVEAARRVVVQAVRMELERSTLLAAEAGAELYDAVRTASVGAPFGALAESDYEPKKTDAAIRGFVRFIVRDESPGKRDGIKQFNDAVLQRVDYEMKRAANMSTVSNGKRDRRRPKYARVPTGKETCDFCLMLASRGFVYRSESTASARHVHSHCDCRIVPGWDGDYVKGYDPDEIYDEWQAQVSAMAKERAERKGTTERYERSKIMKGYKDAADVARRKRKGGSATA